MIEITLKFAIFLYIVLYGLDLTAALEFRRVNKKEFEKVEANSVFVRNLNHYGIFKGILMTIFTVELQYMIMIAIGLFGSLWVVLGSINMKLFIMVFLFFNSIFHGLGALTMIFYCIKYANEPFKEPLKEEKNTNHSQRKKDKDDGSNVSLFGATKQLQGKKDKDEHMLVNVDNHVDSRQKDSISETPNKKQDSSGAPYSQN